MTPPTQTPGSLPPVPVPPRDPAIQAVLDAEHLRLLEIGFYISGAVTAFRFIWFLLIAIFFIITGLAASFTGHPGTSESTGNPPPAFVFFILALVFGFILILTLIFAGLEIYAGRCLKRREHPVMIQVIAALYCLSLPWGTALGVFTFMVLNRASVKSLFEPK